MRTWTLPLLLAVLMAGCAPQQAVRPKVRHPSGFPSADAKNVHDFLIRYQQVIAGNDPKAILHLYADKARMVPYLVENKHVLTKKGLKARLPDIIRAQRLAGMQLTFREPMDIKVTASGERATVEALADLAWTERGRPHQVTLDCYFQMVRLNYIWKIKESHQLMATPGQAVPGRTAAPAVHAPVRDRQFSDTPPFF